MSNYCHAAPKELKQEGNYFIETGALHEPESPPLGFRVNTLDGSTRDIFACKHCGCVYVATEEK